MAGSLSYKLSAEKSLPGPVSLMKWCPKMDLIALVMDDNSLLLHRLSWQKVWAVESGDVTITSLSWRPDGKVLGVSYGSGDIKCYSVEDGTVCNCVRLDEYVTTLMWIEYENKNDLYKDTTDQFINPLPSIDNNEEDMSVILSSDNRSSTDSTLNHTSSLSLLLAGDKLGNIHFIVDGVFHLTYLCNVQDTVSYHVTNLTMSHDLKQLASLNLNDNNVLQYHLYDTSLIAEKHKELHYIAVKSCQIEEVVDYLGNVLHAMVDLWEDGLTSIDKKMEDYSKTLPNYLTIMDEFIILLACGQARSELKTFLLESLTAKGVKKIGLALEMSYKSLRRYTINHIERAIETLNFHLNDLLSISRWSDVFGPLGLSSTALTSCVKELTQFALKAQEFLFVLDDSLQNLKIFFVWLYTIIVKLSGETVPTFVEEGPSPEELQMVVDFLKKRLQPVFVEGRGQTFSLDRVGQYLLDKDLLITEDYNKDTLWDNILSRTTSLNKDNVPWLIERSPRTSLMQCYLRLQESLNIALKSCQKVIKPSLKRINLFTLSEFNSASLPPSLSRVATLHCYEERFVCCFPYDDQAITIMSHDYVTDKMKCGQCFITSTSDSISHNCEVNDISIYDDQTLSLLYSSTVNQSKYYTVAQLPLDTVTMVASMNIINHESLLNMERVDIGSHLLQVTSLGRFQAKQLTVSGSRKLAAILSFGAKRIQLFDVDAEEEGDEDDI